jgi:hypothetical protein
MEKVIRISVVLTFLLMIAINSLANIIPINGINTGNVSDSLSNLFTPTAITFSIWGVIYVMLALYTFYQYFYRGKFNLNKVNIWFSISSVSNALWIFAWHYKIIWLSFLFMIVMLTSLIIINNSITKETLSVKERLLIRIPFSIYFGWITVATIANTTVLLVSLGWNGFGLSEVLWATVIIIVGALIGLLTTLINRDITYGLVIIWAYIGILIKHISSQGFDNMYPQVIITVGICLFFLATTVLFTLIKKPA